MEIIFAVMIAVGIGMVLLSNKKTPHPYFPPEILDHYEAKDGTHVTVVRARNAVDAASVRDGMTIAGDYRKETVKQKQPDIYHLKAKKQ